jgi:hypothetical protein
VTAADQLGHDAGDGCHVPREGHDADEDPGHDATLRTDWHRVLTRP